MQMILQCISEMVEVYQTKELKQFLAEIQKDDFKKVSKWKLPLHWHVTTLFVGGNKALKNDPILLNFKENELVPINIEGLVFVPDKILFGICFPNTGVKNKVPHVTLMTNQWKPKDSNTVAEALFVDGKFKNEYENVFKNVEYQEKFVENINLKIGDEEVTAYLMKLCPSHRFNGYNRYFQ